MSKGETGLASVRSSGAMTTRPPQQSTAASSSSMLQAAM